MEFKSLYQIPFEVKYLFNEGYNPEDDDFFVSKDQINDLKNQWTELENQIIIKNLVIEYDSDGDEYSTESWPSGIRLIGNKELEISYEDDGLLIEYNSNYIKFNQIASLSVGKFIESLKLFDIELELTEIGKTINNTATNGIK